MLRSLRSRYSVAHLASKPFFGVALSPLLLGSTRSGCRQQRQYSKQTVDSIVYAGKYLTVVKRKNWEFVTRPNARTVVKIVPITKNHELVLIEQFREPLQQVVLELPAGLVGDIDGQENEDLMVAGQRELLEETGYRNNNSKEKWKYLMVGPSSAGLTDETVELVLATDVEKFDETPVGDGCEDIRKVHTIPLHNLSTFLDEKRKDKSIIIDYKVYSAMGYFYLHEPELLMKSVRAASLAQIQGLDEEGIFSDSEEEAEFVEKKSK